MTPTPSSPTTPRPETAAARSFRVHCLDPFRPSHLAALRHEEREGLLDTTALKRLPHTHQHFQRLASRPIVTVRRPTEVVSL